MCIRCRSREKCIEFFEGSSISSSKTVTDLLGFGTAALFSLFERIAGRLVGVDSCLDLDFAVSARKCFLDSGVGFGLFIGTTYIPSEPRSLVAVSMPLDDAELIMVNLPRLRACGLMLTSLNMYAAASSNMILILRQYFCCRESIVDPTDRRLASDAPPVLTHPENGPIVPSYLTGWLDPSPQTTSASILLHDDGS